MKELLPEIEKLIVPYLEEQGCELVEIETKGAGRSRVLRVYVYKEGGLPISTIKELSRGIEEILDAEDIIQGPYILEVSSPGLDRKLTTVRDFQRVVGEEVKLFMKDGRVILGYLSSAGDVLHLRSEDGGVDIPVDDVEFGKIVIKF
ncbi:ribosome maturation factor RimP [bacterium]|nr:ribosome maturation factor RimP [bacterium]